MWFLLDFFVHSIRYGALHGGVLNGAPATPALFRHSKGYVARPRDAHAYAPRGALPLPSAALGLAGALLLDPASFLAFDAAVAARPASAPPSYVRRALRAARVNAIAQTATHLYAATTGAVGHPGAVLLLPKAKVLAQWCFLVLFLLYIATHLSLLLLTRFPSRFSTCCDRCSLLVVIAARSSD